MILFFNIIFILVTVKFCRNITLPINDINGVPTIKVCMGSPLQCITSSLYFSTCVSYVSSKSISFKYSNLYQPLSSQFHHQLSSVTLAYYYDLLKMQIKGILGEDIITLNLGTIGKIQFYYATSLSTVPSYEGIVGLCFHPSQINFNYSLLNQIKDNSIVLIN